jgi:hypothetical protein
MINIDPMVRGRLATRLASDATVQQVAVSSKPPLVNGPLPTTTMTASATSVAQNAGYAFVSPEYFPMFDIQIVRGRTFTSAEASAGAAVALVSEATAAALWPGLDPLAQTLDLPQVPEGRTDRRLPRGRVRVVGVTEDVAAGSILDLDGIDATCVYFPTSVQAAGDTSFLVRARIDNVEVLRAAVTAAVNEIAPETPFGMVPMRTLIAGAAWIFQAFSVAASLLGLVGLLFAYSGTHAVVSYLVAQRRREFGVRMALGASGWRVVRGMLVETSRIAAIGLVATAVAALWSLRRAMQIDPAQALRAE